MKEKKITYFKEFTATDEKNLKQFNKALTSEEFGELYQMAKEAYKDTPHTKPFDNEQVFITSPNTFNGFYFPNNSKPEERTGYKLLLIAFEVVHHYDFNNHAVMPDTLRALPIYTDGAKNYILKISILDRRPLEDWQRDLKKTIKDYTAKLKGWEKVKRIYKKDGKPFANIAKNFEGVKVFTVLDTYEKKEYKLELYAGDCLTGYTSDCIYHCDSSPLNTLDDILPAIEKRKKQLQIYITEASQKLEFSEKIYLKIVGEYVQTVINYSTPTNREGVAFPHLHYYLKEMLKHIYLGLF